MCDGSTGLIFLSLKQVIAIVGLGKSEIYRRRKDTDPALNPFPQPRPYKGPNGKRVFWLSTEIRAWQLRELGIDPPPAAPDIDDLLG